MPLPSGKRTVHCHFIHVTAGRRRTKTTALLSQMVKTSGDLTQASRAEPSRERESTVHSALVHPEISRREEKMSLARFRLRSLSQSADYSSARVQVLAVQIGRGN